MKKVKIGDIFEVPTVSGLTPAQLENLFTPAITNPVPKSLRAQ